MGRLLGYLWPDYCSITAVSSVPLLEVAQALMRGHLSFATGNYARDIAVLAGHRVHRQQSPSPTGKANLEPLASRARKQAGRTILHFNYEAAGARLCFTVPLFQSPLLAFARICTSNPSSSSFFYVSGFDFFGDRVVDVNGLPVHFGQLPVAMGHYRCGRRRRRRRTSNEKKAPRHKVALLSLSRRLAQLWPRVVVGGNVMAMSWALARREGERKQPIPEPLSLSLSLSPIRVLHIPLTWSGAKFHSLCA